MNLAEKRTKVKAVVADRNIILHHGQTIYALPINVAWVYAALLEAERTRGIKHGRRQRRNTCASLRGKSPGVNPGTKGE